MSTRLAIDLRMVGRQLHGIARYALELSRRLPFLAPDHRFDLLIGRDFDPSMLGSTPDNVRLVPTSSRFLAPSEQVELPLLLRKLKPSLYHSPSFSVPLGYRGPMAMTIHDANHLAFPQYYSRFHPYYYRYLVGPGAQRAELVLTVSDFARTELEKRLDLPAGKARVIYNGVDPAFRVQSPERIELFRQRMRLPQRFVLYVGNTKPHKNVELLVDAFRMLDDDVSLVLCAGPRAQRLRERAGSRAGQVMLLEGVDDADLPLLYAAASVFAFPSLYEGFGLPPLEAMSCGTPVVSARASALPEVVQDAADLCDPHDAADLARKLQRILDDPAHADELRTRGLAHAAQFSWDESARQVLEAYRSVLPARRSWVCPGVPRRPSVPGPRGAPLKVLFCVRHNLWSITGGDATQILRTKAALEELGVQITLWSQPRPPARGSFDLAHLFHLTRLDTYVQARALEDEGLPFVLSTIYWPTTEFERYGYVGALKVLHSAVAESTADIAKNGVRAVLADGEWRTALLTGAILPLEQRVRFLIERSLLMLPNSVVEGDVLVELGGSGDRIRPIVNAADPAPAIYKEPSEELPERFLLSAGRIEPRKNQLALIEALQGFELPLVIVGAPGPMHADYYRRVQRAAAAADTLLLPARAREELYALYARCEAHIAPAWYETPGLVSLEAAAAGARVVTTDRGSTREYFGDLATYLDPGDKASMRRAVEQVLARPKDEALRKHVVQSFTWERAAEQTLQAYEEALRLHTNRDGVAPRTGTESR